jgi:ubiquinone/menaquinone biosynthesis C-methylase UbiE
LDLGSGPASLGRVLQRPVVNLDLDLGMLIGGRFAMENINVDSNYVNAFMQQIPFASKSFDLANASYSLMYSAQGRKNGDWKREIENALLEINRILKPNGYLLVTLPDKATKSDDLNSFTNAISQYGYEVKLCDFVKILDKNENGKTVRRRRVHLIGALKTEESSGYKTLFDIYRPVEYICPGGGEKRIVLNSSFSIRKPSYIRTTDYTTSSGLNLEKVIFGSY